MLVYISILQDRLPTWKRPVAIGQTRQGQVFQLISCTSFGGVGVAGMVQNPARRMPSLKKAIAEKDGFFNSL